MPKRVLIFLAVFVRIDSRFLTFYAREQIGPSVGVRRRFSLPGCRITVKDGRGDIAILVGARTVRLIFATEAASSRREKAPAKDVPARISSFTSERRRYAASRPAP